MSALECEHLFETFFFLLQDWHIHHFVWQNKKIRIHQMSISPSTHQIHDIGPRYPVLLGIVVVVSMDWAKWHLQAPIHALHPDRSSFFRWQQNCATKNTKSIISCWEIIKISLVHIYVYLSTVKTSNVPSNLEISMDPQYIYIWDFHVMLTDLCQPMWPSAWFHLYSDNRHFEKKQTQIVYIYCFFLI